MFAEPARTAYDLNFSIAGVPVRIHPFFWVATLLLGARPDTPPKFVLVWMLVVLVSILVHELGHVFAFRRFRVPSHVVLYVFGGLAVPESRTGFAAYGGGIRTPQDQIVVSLAGPAAGFLLAALAVCVLWASGFGVDYELFGYELFAIPGRPLPSVEAEVFVFYLLYVNIMWGLVNLLPIMPLDGGRVFESLFTILNPRDGTRQALILSMFTAGCLAALALLKFQSLYLTLMFGYLAFLSYQLLEFRGGGYGGGRW